MAENVSPKDMVLTPGYFSNSVYNFYRDMDFPEIPVSANLMQSLPKGIDQIEKSNRIWLIAVSAFQPVQTPFFYRLAPDLPDPFPQEPIVRSVPAKGSAGSVCWR